MKERDDAIEREERKRREKGRTGKRKEPKREGKGEVTEERRTGIGSEKESYKKGMR